MPQGINMSKFTEKAQVKLRRKTPKAQHTADKNFILEKSIFLPIWIEIFFSRGNTIRKQKNVSLLLLFI